MQSLIASLIFVAAAVAAPAPQLKPTPPTGSVTIHVTVRLSKDAQKKLDRAQMRLIYEYDQNNPLRKTNCI